MNRLKEIHFKVGKFSSACGEVDFHQADLTDLKVIVTCRRCIGTEIFSMPTGKGPKHAAALVFLRQAIARLDATIQSDIYDPRKDQFKDIKEDVEESIRLLEALQWVEQKATDIRSKKK